MARRSLKPGRKAGYQIHSGASSVVHTVKLARGDQNDSGVSVSLKYLRTETECLSEWHRPELKKLVKAIEKMRNMTVHQVVVSPLCSQHKYVPKLARFVRPPGLGPDLPIYEIRVDQHNSARMHGGFTDDVFHLVWLDKDHQVFAG